jgi:UPF0755 protein
MRKALIILAIILAGLLAWQILFPIGSDSSEEVFRIEKGEGSRDIALNLQEEGLIRWGPMFRLYVLFTASADELQAGTYSLSKSMNIPRMVGKFTNGEVIREKLTVIEGWSLRNIGYHLENKGLFQAEEFWEVAGFPATDYLQATDLPEPKDFSGEYSFLESKPDNVGLEGFLFPDTYEVTMEAEVEDIVRKMLDNFDQKLTLQLREEIARQGKTIFDIITMASILEREVQTKEDKEIVSGIFWKRMKLQKPLESCATIAYIKGVDQWRYSFEDTRIESPFNTYLNYGLPLGPISNPGMDSILAAVYPESTEYLYYLSTPEGQTIFSKTFEEHSQAKAEYLN